MQCNLFYVQFIQYVIEEKYMNRFEANMLGKDKIMSYERKSSNRIPFPDQKRIMDVECWNKRVFAVKTMTHFLQYESILYENNLLAKYIYT